MTSEHESAATTGNMPDGDANITVLASLFFVVARSLPPFRLIDAMTPKRQNSTEGLEAEVASAWFVGRNAAFAALVSQGAGWSLAEDLASEACTEALAMGKLGETSLVRTIAVTNFFDRMRHDRAARRFYRLQRAVNNRVGVVDSDRKAELALVCEALKELQRDLDVRIVVDCLKRGVRPTQAAIDFGMSPSNARRRFVVGLTKIRSRVGLRVCSRDSGDSVDTGNSK